MWNEDDLQPITIRGDSIEVVPDFRYLGSIVEAHGEVLKDVEDKIARALCRPVFQDRSLSLRTKRMVYRAVVMGLLLYGAETWVNKRAATRKLEFFNNKCILGISRAQQRIGYITSAEVRRRFGVEEVLEDVVAAKRLRWPARMDVCRLPKTPRKRPAHGTKLRDKVRKDLKHLGIEESSWYKEAQDRGHWRAMCKEGLATCTEERQRKGRAYGHGPPSTTGTSEFTAPVLVCPTCSRTFSRRQDIARHKCQTTRPRGSRAGPANAV